MSNAAAFEALAERQMAAPIKRKRARQAASVAPTALEKKLREKQKLSAAYRRAQRKTWRNAMVGEHGPYLVELRRTLRRFGPDDAEPFVAYVEGLSWPREVDAETRALAMTVVSNRIIQIRMSVGLHPFDDSFPDEPDCAFTRCRKAILGR